MKKLLPVLIFFVVAGVFFSPTILQGKLPVPSDTLVGLYHPWRDAYAEQYPRGMPFKNFLITDPIRQQIPWRKIGIEELKNGKLPFWNPYAFTGTPLLGNIQSGLLYPLNVLFFIFSFPTAWSFLIMLQPILAGIFLYLYLSSRKLHPWACLISSIAWSLSGFSIAWLTWGTIVHTVLWLPLFLLCIDKLFSIKESRSKLFWASLLGVTIAFSFFAGHAQVFLYCIVCAISYGMFRIKELGHIDKKILIPFLPVVIIFLLITFFQWKELYSLVLLSSRVTEENLMNKEGWFLPWQHLIQFFIPDYFGNPATLNYWGTWNYGELVGYIGILPLVFAFYGVFAKKFHDKTYWISTLVVSLLFLLPTPIAKLPYFLQIPIWSTLQPTRIIVLVVFSLVVLSAYGLHALLERNVSLKNPTWIVFSILGVLILIPFGISQFSNTQLLKDHMNISFRNSLIPGAVFLLGCASLLFLKKNKFQYLVLMSLVILTSFDLLRFGRKFTPFTDPEYFFPPTKIITYLQSQPKPFRILAADDRVFPPNTAGYYGIEMVSGYDPLYSKYYEGVIAAHNRGEANLAKPYGFNRIITPALSRTPVFDVLGIDYIVTYGPVNTPDYSLVMSEGESYLYKNILSLNRFFFVSEVISVASYESGIDELFKINPRHQAVVQGNLSVPSGAITEKEMLTLVDYSNSSITLASTTNVDRYIVILNSYFPGWKATVDGVHTPVYQTNGSFMGIVVPEGQHTIQLRYEG